jgi:DNA helicase-2/ATP-dependent DNA helicase PcrA
MDSGDSRALLLTFTNKAAAEMKTRAIGVSGIASTRIEASTFHTFGATVLRNHGHLLGITPEFDILDDEQAKEVADEIVASTVGITNQRAAWGSARRARREPSAAVAAFGEAYEAGKRAEEVLDFDDLIIYTARLFEENVPLASAYAVRFPHLLVDEFQDTNASQFAIVKALASRSQTASVFADDDQAIFRFADAEARNIRRFAEELGATVYPLTCNYRCRDEIVKRANRLIAAEPSASGRQMRADKPGGVIGLVTYGSTEVEGAVLAEEISRAVHEEGVLPASIAVLVRAGFRANEVVSELAARAVPISDWRGAAYEPSERRSLVTCMSVMRPRLNERRARLLTELMGVELIDERDTHQFLEAHDPHPVALQLLTVREVAFAGGSPSQVVEAASQAAVLAAPGVASGIARLVDAVAGYERFDPDYTLEHLLADMALGSGLRSPTAGGGVKIATLHGTKGLQWPVVYLVGLEEGKLPDFRNVETAEKLAEERRACFVGVCRAEDVLTVTYSQRFRTMAQAPSRFLREMGLIDDS